MSEKTPLEKDAANLLFALHDAWPYIHAHCTVQSLKDHICNLMRRHGDFADIVQQQPLSYESGQPVTTGVYACRVPNDLIPISGFYKDIFLMWHGATWSYLGSTERYRGEVPFFIGPLRRNMKEQRL